MKKQAVIVLIEGGIAEVLYNNTRSEVYVIDTDIDEYLTPDEAWAALPWVNIGIPNRKSLLAQLDVPEDEITTSALVDLFTDLNTEK